MKVTFYFKMEDGEQGDIPILCLSVEHAWKAIYEELNKEGLSLGGLRELKIVQVRRVKPCDVLTVVK